MTLTKIGKIYHWPLFVGTICGTFLALAFVPGRLEYHIMELLVWTPAFFIESLPYTIMLVFGLFSYVIYRFLWKKQRIQNIFNLSSIISLSILLTTSLLLHFNIPARLCFYKYQQQFERTAKVQAFNEGIRRNITKVGDIEIYYTFVEPNNGIGIEDKHIYFGTQVINSSPKEHFYGYGFAYLPHLPKEEIYGNISLHDNWYIFHDLDHVCCRID